MIRRPCAANVQKATQFLTAIHRTLWGHSRPVVRSQAPSATLVPSRSPCWVTTAISTQSVYAWAQLRDFEIASCLIKADRTHNTGKQSH